MREPVRIDGYAPIGDYAAIGDGRALALVALDGAIDWLCLPEFDSPTTFAALLDAERGGAFTLRPAARFRAERRYRDASNVLQTTFRTGTGCARITDAMTLQSGSRLPWWELVRGIEGLEGEVELAWRVEPRPDFDRQAVTIARHGGAPTASWGDQTMAVLSFDAGAPAISDRAIEGRVTVRAGERALLVITHVDDMPLPLPGRDELEDRLHGTADHWRRRVAGLHYRGPFADAVRRSVLTLQMLTYGPTGALAAAGTSSLPERIGGSRNWDYRYGWVRDTGLALDAMLRLGLTADAHRTLAWLLAATSHTHPRLQPIFTLGGLPRLPVEKLDELHGYRGSKPVQIGNGAEGQLQLGNFGDFAQALLRYAQSGHVLDAETGRRLAEIATLVCELWRNDDAGIWEIQNRPYTVSKMSCWVTLDYASRLARQDRIPRENLERWEEEREEIRDYVEERCWSERRQAYSFYADSDDLDAAVLMPIRAGYRDPGHPRVLSTIAAIRDELVHGDGPLVYRYSGMREQEGAFLACSFWIVEALARAGRREEAERMMGELVDLANDVGLYSEEMDPDSREMLGNMPQAITHLALLGAASALAG